MSLYSTLIFMWSTCILAAGGSVVLLHRAKRAPDRIDEEPLRDGRQRMLLLGAIGLWAITILASVVSTIAMLLPGHVHGAIPLALTTALWAALQVGGALLLKDTRGTDYRHRMFKTWFFEATTPAALMVFAALTAVTVAG